MGAYRRETRGYSQAALSSSLGVLFEPARMTAADVRNHGDHFFLIKKKNYLENRNIKREK